MTLPELLLPYVGSFVAVMARIGGLFVFAPVLGSNVIPRQAKAMLVLALALAVHATLPEGVLRSEAPNTLLELGSMVFGEALIGVSIGLLAMLPIVSVQLGGLLIGQQIGMGLAGIYNPAVDSESTIFGQMLLYVALASFLAIGGLEQMLLAVMSTFARVPPGGITAGQAPLELLTNLLTSGFELALRVSAPVMCIIFIETVAMGFIMKTMPQLNILSVGFGVKIMAGLLAIIVGLAAIEHTVDLEVGDTVAAIREWAAGLAPASAPPESSSAELPAALQEWE